MAGSWLHQYLEREKSGEMRKKSARLGKFDPAPMLTTTLDIHGMIGRDALEVVERKINRALLAGATEIKVLHDEKDRKLRRQLHQFLSDLSVVTSFDFDEALPGVTLVRLQPSSEIG